MGVKLIDASLEQPANLIRLYVRSQVGLWQRIPHLALEAQGRPGWDHRKAISYMSGLYPVDQRFWPPRLFVECATGELMDHTAHLASSQLSLRVYLDGMLLDAKRSVKDQEGCAKKHSDQNDTARREEERLRFDVTPVWKRPAIPIEWGFPGPY